MKWLTGYSKKREAAKGFANQTTRQTAQTFILEPILTPSGILDGGDDTPDPLTLDWETNDLPDVDTVDNATEVDDVTQSKISESNSNVDADSSHDEVAVNSLEIEIADEDLETLDFIDNLDIPEAVENESTPTETTASDILEIDSPSQTADSEVELPTIINNEDTEEISVTAEVDSSEVEITNSFDSTIDEADSGDSQLTTDLEIDSNEDLTTSDLKNEVDELDSTLTGGAANETTDDILDDISLSQPNFDYDSGLFTVGETGEVGIDFLFDGGGYKGELAIFSLDGMDEFEPGSQEFIKEAASRALSSSDLGHIVIADASEGARFSGNLGEANRNEGAYLGVKTFSMRPGDTFAVMLVPNGKVEQVFNNPAIGGAVRPLFSLVTSNPNDAFHVGQIADVTGDGNTFVMEDMRVDTGSDRDYNDIVFQVRGATGKAALMDDVVASGKDWRTSDLGQALIAYAEPYIEPEIVENDFFVDDDSLIYDDELAFYDEYLDSQFNEDFPSEDFPEIADSFTGEEVVEDIPEVTDLPIDEAVAADDQELVDSPISQEVIADNQEVYDLPKNEELVGEVPVNSTVDQKEMLFSSLAEKSSDIGSDVTDEVTVIEEDVASNLLLNDSIQEEIVPEVLSDEFTTLEVVTTETSSDLTDDSLASQEVTEVVPENVSDKPIDAESSIVANTSEVVSENSSLPKTTTSVTKELITEVTENGSTITTNVDVSATDSSVAIAAEAENEVSQVIGTESDVVVEKNSIAPDTTEVSYIPPISLDVKPPIEYEFPPENQPLIGVIDTGFAANNPDVDYSRITLGTDLVANDSNPLLEAGEGSEHGTHVLGIIAAQRNNDVGIDGINDDAPLWVGRAIGSGKWAESLVEFVDAAKESAQPNAVVNLSLDLTQINADGSVTTRYEFTPTEMAAIEYARQNNVLIVVAAGNDGGVMSALGQASQEFDNIITVGAAERVSDAVALSKAYDRASYSSYGYGLDIVADGGSINNPILSTTGDGVGTMAGTSVASAKVTGAASQVWAANPNLSYRQVIELLKNTATDLKTPNWDAETGSGLLNIGAAVSFAKVTIGEEYRPELMLVPTTWSGQGKVMPTERAARTPYTIRSGDTLWEIAQRYLGNGTRWREITKDQHGTPFTDAEARYLHIGQVVYLPGNIAEEEARLRAEEARRRAEEEVRLRAEEEARRRAEEEARRHAEEARRHAEEEVRLRAEEEARRRAEEEARRSFVSSFGNIASTGFNNFLNQMFTKNQTNQGNTLTTQARQQGSGTPISITTPGQVANNRPLSVPVQDVVLKPGATNLNFSRGQQWVTSTGYKFIFQNDGNLVLYNPQGKPIWATGTEGTGADRFSVQTDGNVVLYDGNQPLWATNTDRNIRSSFAIQNDGNLVVYSSSGKAIFNTGTYGGREGTRSASAQWLRDRNLNRFPGLQFSTVTSKATGKALDAGGSNNSVYPHSSRS